MTSISSYLKTVITSARNRYGEEANWLVDERKIKEWPSRWALIGAEAGYVLITIVSLVEHVVSVLLIIVTSPILPIYEAPSTLVLNWYKSSSFCHAWAFSYAVVNLVYPHLPTQRTTIEYFFKANQFKNPIWNVALIGYRFLRFSTEALLKEITVEMPILYAQRFKEKPEVGHLEKIKRYTQLALELLGMVWREGVSALYDLNAKLLSNHFEIMNREVEKTQRAICAYFVSAQDHNGAVLGPSRFWDSHMDCISRYQEHYDVSAKVVKTTREIFDHLKELKKSYPSRPIQAVIIRSHGSPSSLGVSCSEKAKFTLEDVEENQFAPCAPDAAIIFSGCSMGKGEGSIAELIATKNQGKSIFANEESTLGYPHPSFKMGENGIAEVETVKIVTQPYRLFRFAPS